MKVIDLTHELCDDMTVFSKEESPRLNHVNTLNKHGFNQTLLNIFSHNGTHIDSPTHLLKDALSLYEMDVSNFIGSGIVIDCRDLINSKNKIIDFKYIEKDRENIDKSDFVIFNTGYSLKWGSEEYFDSYPLLHKEVIEYIINTNKKGVGVDLISVDSIESHTLPIHHRILENNIIIIENLTNLDKLGQGIFQFFALPLKYKKSDGSPVRAIGITK